MKGIVIYQSKYGATRQYAHWIGSELNMPVVETGNLSAGQLNNYDVVIAGSSVYIGKLLIKRWLRHHWKSLLNKKLLLFVVSGTPPEKQEKLDRYMETSLPAELRDKCDIHFLPGRLLIKKLSFLDRFILKAGARLSGDEKTKSKMLSDYDSVKKENILPLLKAARKFQRTEIPAQIPLLH